LLRWLDCFCPELVKLAGVGKAPLEPECVICLEGFDAINPHVPTLCSCGLGVANFHRSCLEEWVRRNHGSSTCPTCANTLFYEEPIAVPTSVRSLHDESSTRI
jgi:hypothetical protein